MRRWGKFYYRGKYTELALIKKLRKKGIWCSRLPRSGKGYGFDIVAVKDGKVFFIEVKRRTNAAVIYIDREHAEGLISSGKAAGATPLLVLYDATEKEWFVREMDKPDARTGKYYRYDMSPMWKKLDSIF